MSVRPKASVSHASTLAMFLILMVATPSRASFVVFEQVWCQQRRTGRAGVAKEDGRQAACSIESPRKMSAPVGHFQHLRTDGWERFAGESLSGCGSGCSVTRAQ